MRPYFVLSLPRSGTAWLANFLTWGDSFCYHELGFGCESLDDLEHALKKVGTEHTGMADTAAVMFWDVLAERFPAAKFLFVVRDKEDVRQALKFHGFDSSGLDTLGQALSAGCRSESITSATIPYDGIFSSTGMRQIWEYLELPEPFPWRRFELLREMNIQDFVRKYPDTQYAEEKIDISLYRFGKLLESMQPPQQRSFG